MFWFGLSGFKFQLSGFRFRPSLQSAQTNALRQNPGFLDGTAGLDGEQGDQASAVVYLQPAQINEAPRQSRKPSGMRHFAGDNPLIKLLARQ